MVNHMQHFWRTPFWFSLVVTAVIAQTAPNQQFPLPKSHVRELKSKQVCIPVGTAEIGPTKETAGASEKILVEAGRGTHRLEITLAEKE